MFGEDAADELLRRVRDAVANPSNADVTPDELLALAAADVQDLEPPAGGVVGSSWLGVALTIGLLVVSGLLVRWRSRLRPEDFEDRDDPDPDDEDPGPDPDDPPPRPSAKEQGP
mgnify:CR=1 FL=1